MASILISTIAFFVAGYMFKRYLDNADIPKGPTRSILIFVVAAGISYGVAFVVDKIVS